MKQTINATFSNGKSIIRKSVKSFGFAWFAKNKWQSDTGFASTKESAEKYAKTRFNGTESPTQEWEVVKTSVA